MEMPGYEVEVEVRHRGGWKETQNDTIVAFLAPLLTYEIEKDRPTLPPTKGGRYHSRLRPWEVSWDKVDDVQSEVEKQFRRMNDYQIWQVFESVAAEALAELAERHPKELEGFLVENFLVRSVRSIHEGVGPSEPRASSKR